MSKANEDILKKLEVSKGALKHDWESCYAVLPTAPSFQRGILLTFEKKS
jgi:hypothetical protein